jgi:Divergent InlB B-repeat domain
MNNGSRARRSISISLMVVTVLVVAAYGTSVAANLAASHLPDGKHPNPQPSPVVQFTLGVHVVGSGAGTVNSPTLNTSCSSNCQSSVDAGTEVELTAQPGAGSRFVTWGAGCHGHGTECTVAMTRSTHVVAVFVKLSHLSVSDVGPGSVGNFSGIHCPPDCGQLYAPGMVVHLFHHARAGSHFVHWSGACSGRGACVLTMHGPRFVRGVFARNPKHHH